MACNEVALRPFDPAGVGVHAHHLSTLLGKVNAHGTVPAPDVENPLACNVGTPAKTMPEVACRFPRGVVSHPMIRVLGHRRRLPLHGSRLPASVRAAFAAPTTMRRADCNLPQSMPSAPHSRL